MTRIVAVLAMTVALALVGCSGDGNDGATSGDESSPTPTEDSAPSEAQTECSNELDVVGDPEKQRGDGLSGDVDGDGAEDTVRVYVDEEAPPMCASFVVVETATGFLVAAIDEPQLSFDLGQPGPRSLVQMDGTGGLEVTVDVLSGASTQFLAAFTVTEGELERVRLPGAELFATGASVTHLDVSDCLPEGEVALSNAVREGGRNYEVTRRLYEFDGTRWRKASTERESGVGFDEFGGYPEFRGGSPFGSCPQAAEASRQSALLAFGQSRGP